MVVSNIKTNAEPPLIDTKAVMEQNIACSYVAKYFVWCSFRQLVRSQYFLAMYLKAVVV